MKTLFIFCCTLFLIPIVIHAQHIEVDLVQTNKGTLRLMPIQHASMILRWNNLSLFVDPAMGAKGFEGKPHPDLILITDIHGDHFDTATLHSLTLTKTIFIVPPAVAAKLPSWIDSKNVHTLKNGESAIQLEIEIDAIPMYNLPESKDAYHTKGRGNGYVLTFGDKHVYISGDTEDIPEMLALKNIDVAFVCANLPYTMDIQQASKSVLTFKPKIFVPYHYKGQDVNELKKLVNNANPEIQVLLFDWYL